MAVTILIGTYISPSTGERHVSRCYDIFSLDFPPMQKLILLKKQQFFCPIEEHFPWTAAL